MTKRLSLLAGLVVVLGFPVKAAAQSLPMRVTTAAPASLVCNQTGTATVTLQTPTPPFELMLVIDESGSIASQDFTRLKTFMLNVARSFTYGPNNTRWAS